MVDLTVIGDGQLSDDAIDALAALLIALSEENESEFHHPHRPDCGTGRSNAQPHQ